MAKHKNKRGRGKRESSIPTPSLTGGAAASAAAITEATQSDTPPRPEGNVIQFPKSPAAEAPSATTSAITETAPAEKSDAARTTLRAGTGDFPAEDSKALSEALREAAGERDRPTEPPAEPEAKAEEKPEAKAVERAAEEPEAKATAKEEPRPEAKKDAKKDAPNPGSTTAVLKAASPKEEVKRREDTRRDRKESLSTHLSDEARAFFSDHALTAAYKSTHDTFEDLAPAADEHPHDAARSRRWMVITGGLLVAVVAIVAGFSIYDRVGVHETNLATIPGATPSAATPTPATPPTAPEATPPTAPTAEAPSAAAPEPPAAAPAVEAPTAPTAEAPSAPAAPTAEAPSAPAAPTAEAPAPPAAPVAEAPAPSAVPAAPAANAQELLATARRTRGPWPQRLAAYDAYFAAAPTDDRTMGTLSFSLAEASRWADAERVAARAVAANERNAQAWFVLAAARQQTGNREGSREARARCVALGGRWAAECRAIP